MAENLNNYNDENLDRIIKRLAFYILWFIILVWYFSSLGGTSLLSLLIPVLLILPIWFFKDRKNKDANISSMLIRIKNCRPNYKTRSILSIVLFILFFSGSFASIVGNIQEEKKASKERMAYLNAATPTINIISKEGDIGDTTGYNLIYTTKDATEVIVNGESINLEGKEDIQNSVNYSLEGFGNHTLNILIVAKNEYKRSEKTVSVTRNKTKEETDAYNKELARIEAERTAVDTDRIDGYIKEMSDGYIFYDIPTINQTIAKLQLLRTLIEEDINNENKKIAQKAQEAKNKLIATQKTVFPRMRDKRCDISDETMWDYDIDVKCSGTTVKFIGGAYAANKNIKDSYLAVKDMLYKLRFKKANFYRYEGSDYTYYTIDSLNDGDLE